MRREAMTLFWNEKKLKEEFASNESVFLNYLTLCEQRLEVGHGPKLAELVDSLPAVDDSKLLFDGGVTLSGTGMGNQKGLDEKLHGLSPWRKGPINFFNTFIDTEWRSDWKWDRVESALPSLEGKTVLDIGCGNGYYMFRMLPFEPRLIVGLDPFLLYAFQFAAVQKYARAERIQFFPTSFADFPDLENQFDVIFCMGVLYHQRSPIEFLGRMRKFLRPQGTLVLETLTLAGDDPIALSPPDRYAKMHNCFFLPTDSCLDGWLRRAQFVDTRLVDANTTSVNEQRQTEWMTFESLEQFLEPVDLSKTIEGYPAPRRSLVLAQKR